MKICIKFLLVCVEALGKGAVADMQTFTALLLSSAACVDQACNIAIEYF